MEIDNDWVIIVVDKEEDEKKYIHVFEIYKNIKKTIKKIIPIKKLVKDDIEGDDL